MNARPNSAPVPAEQVFDWLDAEAARRVEAGLAHRPQPRGATPGELDLAGDDYLGLAKDKRVAGAAAAAALRWGAGSTGSPVNNGSTELHAELEHELARFCGTQAALVFSSGFLANLAAVTALSGGESAIVTDRHLGASLIEGCRLSRADVAAVAHSDTAAIKHALATRRKARALVVTDSVFSVDGHLAPLAELSTACREHGAGLLIDDAHGFGVLGDGGRGAVQAAGLAAEPDVVTTISLAKALGAQGGAVLGPRRVIRQIAETARGFLADTRLAPSSVAAALAALGVLKAEPELPGAVQACAVALAAGLRDGGLSVSSPQAALMSVRAPSAADAANWAARCAEQGVRVGFLRPPSVPDGVSRLRLTVHARLTESNVDTAVKVVSASAPSAATS
ncbi:8-amino-7-oxononanoate synthase [Amycolatopsis taiwanensis]|uniref:8-amino-7-oxononanoate synthase n=1 Tax=Amycolatopsis taiwanensis TaxID=342230 RepID=A0A9W6R1Q7_9PSEU|nr:8-amino-7-oxononanoate synthase [Amycolatopsis taiwanensis]GLY67111.1 8-amino-7-oxononanoate synthase [Amycolatopsis taiwanensis]